MIARSRGKVPSLFEDQVWNEKGYVQKNRAIFERSPERNGESGMADKGGTDLLDLDRAGDLVYVVDFRVHLRFYAVEGNGFRPQVDR